MCALCEKIDTMKDIMRGYFTEEEIAQMNAEIGYEGWNVTGSRLSMLIMAIVEMCIDAGLTGHDVHDGVEVAIMRDHMRRVQEAKHPGRKHTVREKFNGYES